MKPHNNLKTHVVSFDGLACPPLGKKLARLPENRERMPYSTASRNLSIGHQPSTAAGQMSQMDDFPTDGLSKTRVS